jgi:hypothetical protein
MACADEKSVHIWSVPERPIWTQEIYGIMHISFSPDDQYIVCIGYLEMTLYDVVSGTKLATVQDDVFILGPRILFSGNDIVMTES